MGDIVIQMDRMERAIATVTQETAEALADLRAQLVILQRPVEDSAPLERPPLSVDSLGNSFDHSSRTTSAAAAPSKRPLSADDALGRFGRSPKAIFAAAIPERADDKLEAAAPERPPLLSADDDMPELTGLGSQARRSEVVSPPLLGSPLGGEAAAISTSLSAWMKAGLEDNGGERCQLSLDSFRAWRAGGGFALTASSMPFDGGKVAAIPCESLPER